MTEMSEPQEKVVIATEENSFLVEENCPWFRDLQSAARPHLTSKLDLLALSLHAFMVELGFVGELDSDELAGLSWRQAGGWFLQYRLQDGGSPHRFHLSIFRLGPTLTKVHGLSESDKSAYFTTKLGPEEFVEGGAADSWRLRSLAKLSRTFKNEVGYPLLQTGRRLAGHQSGGLLSLPPELALTILCHLGRLGSKCKGRSHKIFLGPFLGMVRSVQEGSGTSEEFSFIWSFLRFLFHHCFY
jgi:hypothetical protein